MPPHLPGRNVPRNVEIKARLRDPDAVRRRLEGLAADAPVRIAQEDTFFPAADGRLKLRLFSDGSGELIGYHRPDHRGPRLSEYAIHATRHGQALRDLLASALGTRGIVRKERDLYHVGRTRVHLDRVVGLGSFLELEVVLGTGESIAEGERIADGLLRALGIEAEDLVDVAYIDLLERR